MTPVSGQIKYHTYKNDNAVNKPETNKHHLIFPRRYYRTANEKLFRTHPLMIVRTGIESHKELHALLQPPRKLELQMILGTLSMLDEIKEENLPFHESITELSSYLSNRTRKEKLVGINLMKQLEYIDL